MRTKAQWTGVLAIAAALGVVQARAQCCGHHDAPWHGASCPSHGIQGAVRQDRACPNTDCWSANGQYGRMYDPKTVATISGVVQSVERFTTADGISAGVHLVLKTEKETISVHLGPSWYLDNQDAQIEPKDKLEITGSRVLLDGKPVLIAAVVKKADGILKLRDENGIPLWAGWRKR